MLFDLSILFTLYIRFSKLSIGLSELLCISFCDWSI
nr:MAG TPA: hypothetical protein [Caudoviricetes sp.]DAY57909.1 MAG TPA: hypothetical protein [Caudoviricetes sp.]